MFRRTTLAALAPLLFAASGPPAVDAAVKTETIEYEYDGTTFRGHLAYDDAVDGERPGVLVVHEWWGLNDYARGRAEQLAALGYTAFALDLYGGGKTAEHPAEAQKFAGTVRENEAKWRGRALAGLKVLRDQPTCDAENVAAIGYCFGGATVLQLAYAGAPLKGVVSFHGALPAATDAEAEAIDAGILICHGAADSFTPPAAVEACLKPLEANGVDYTFMAFGGAKHGFTNPSADDRGMDGLAYDAAADRRSWAAMRAMFGELFRDH